VVLGIQIWLALALGPVVLAATPLVTAEGDCPNAEAVRARYEQLGATYPQPDSDAGLPGIAHVALRNGLLEVSLRNESGALIGEREVAAPERCDDRADVAAALLLAWSPGRQQSEVELTYPALANAPPRPAADVVDAASRARVAAPMDWRVDLAAMASLVAPFQRDSVAPGLGLEAGLGRGGSRLGGVVAAALASERSTSLGPGTAHWRAGDLRLGATLRLFGADTGFNQRAAAGAGVALVDARGSGFATTGGGHSVAPEAWGGLRLLGPVWGVFRLIGAAQAIVRTREQDLTASNPFVRRALSAGEAQLTLGVEVNLAQWPSDHRPSAGL
jgi:hypothetical protein